jgi:SAM-dependent methyltransferase
VSLSALLYRSFNRRRHVAVDFRDAKRRLLYSPDITPVEKRLLNSVAFQVCADDTMYASDPFHYLSVGLSAVRCIQEGIRSARKESPVGRILDLPCGYGRVLRFLRVMYPDSAITAADVDTNALSFCRWTFSVTPVLSSPDLRTLSFPSQFDLIWCGSLLTHVDEDGAAALLRVFHDSLRDQGVCVLTTHGRRAAGWMENKEVTYGLADDPRLKLLREFASRGYGYADLPDSPGYGVSAVSHDRFVELARRAGTWHETMFIETGWDNHQDVYAFSR